MRGYALALTYFDGAWWSKGHHAVDEFCRAAREESDDYCIPGYRDDEGRFVNLFPNPARVEHIWWRAVPNHEDGGSTYHEAAPGARGAFPATYCHHCLQEFEDGAPVPPPKPREQWQGWGRRPTTTDDAERQGGR